MTENERQVYLLFCMSGRTEEATAYRERIEVKYSAGEEDQTMQSENGMRLIEEDKERWQ